MKEIKPGGYVMVDTNPPVVMHKGEMRLRDYFAGKAMQAMMSSPELMVVVTADEVLGGNAKERISNLSYKYADAMLEARKNDI
jgi:hypothetical protein